MEIDIEKKSQELKEYVGQYESTKFLGDITFLIQHIRFDKPIKNLQGLSSPQRQLFYLAALNITSEPKQKSKLKFQYSDEEFEHIKSLLNEIELGYNNFFYPKNESELNDEWTMKRMVAMPTFLSYFNQGQLNYEEQVIERVIDYFLPFDNEISKHFGIGVQEFVDIYNFIDTFPNEYLNEKINPKEGQQTWEEFCDEMKNKNLMPWEWNEHLPEHYKNLFSFISDNGQTHRYSKQKLVDKFGEIKTSAFLNTLTCKREKTNFLYYTETNILHYKPIFDIGNEEFQAIEMKQIIHAIFNNLFQFCDTPILREKFYKNRGNKLEDKIEQVFQDFFNNKASIFKGYYTQDGNEQDLLFLIDGLALIIEAKASKRDEPRRNPEMAYPLILSNFEETIQKGYDQAYRVKGKFLDREILKIYNDQKLQKHLLDVKTKNYHSSFSIIVTLERFGQIQTDLNELLEIWDDDEFPWSVCIDDLEVFLLQLKKLGKSKSDLTKFLKFRENLHGRIITADELEICGVFLNKSIDSKTLNGNKTIALTPDHSDIFDETYQRKGLGLKNEKNLEIKTSNKYLPFGGY
ncbi:hypothetical protein GENT5_01170 [Flavobacterium ammoniigenes]|uniref:NERD domain-containing protein n=1 Tax=Flavobacterium ammoniigenes TaxID=1751095 RepID=A0ABM7V2X2_9FLAO|nr:hypothetical protein [Flavobacterium ammoniigenes]BDB53812.1 hypothetical protein GENT5_01170 [Flavobacterium ammoniigenes]